MLIGNHCCFHFHYLDMKIRSCHDCKQAILDYNSLYD